MRKGKSAERRLNVRWSTTEWTPSVRWIARQNGQNGHDRMRAGERLELLQEVLLRRPALRKKRQVLWVRLSGRNITGRNIGLTGPNGSRTSWR